MMLDGRSGWKRRRKRFERKGWSTWTHASTLAISRLPRVQPYLYVSRSRRSSGRGDARDSPQA
eukprot:7224246-Prymnesium_polylepis.1